MSRSEPTDDPTGRPSRVWSSRVLNRSLLDADGTVVGSIVDLLIVPHGTAAPPIINGFVASVDRRRIFVHRLRVSALDRDGVHLLGGTVDLRGFHQRAGELLVVADLYGSRVGPKTVTDIGFLQRSPDSTLSVDRVALGPASRLRLRPSLTIVDWTDVRELFAIPETAGEAVKLRDLHKADAAIQLGALTSAQRTALAAELDAEDLADVLEELPEDQQVEIIEGLDQQEALAVLEEMEVDDAIDLLKELPLTEREAFLAQMDEDVALRLRVLIGYREDSAGGMMTPEPVILAPDAPVAYAIARLRNTDLPPALAARLFVTEAPTATPTGTYRGTATLQRLLQEPPSRRVGECLATDVPTVAPHASEREVAELFARYDLLSVAVVDGTGRLVGAVTVDDAMLRLVERTWGASS